MKRKYIGDVFARTCEKSNYEVGEATPLSQIDSAFSPPDRIASIRGHSSTKKKERKREKRKRRKKSVARFSYVAELRRANAV